jgi:hypothetical protein
MFAMLGPEPLMLSLVILAAIAFWGVIFAAAVKILRLPLGGGKPTAGPRP